MDNENKQDKITNLLSNMVELRQRCEKSKSQLLKKQLESILSTCTQELEYLIDYRTKRYKNFANYEDLKQDGRMALYRALQTYDPAKGDFYWWCNKYIKTKISREANRHSTIKVPLKHAKSNLPYKVQQIPVLVDASPNPLEAISTDQINVLIREAVEKLPIEQRKVIKLHYELSGGVDRSKGLCSIGKICDKLNISRANCLKLLSDAKSSLQKELADIY